MTPARSVAGKMIKLTLLALLLAGCSSPAPLDTKPHIPANPRDLEIVNHCYKTQRGDEHCEPVPGTGKTPVRYADEEVEQAKEALKQLEGKH